MDIISHRYTYIHIYIYVYIFKYTHTYIYIWYIYIYVKYSHPGVDTVNVAFQPLNGRVRVYSYLDGMGMPCQGWGLA